MSINIDHSVDGTRRYTIFYMGMLSPLRDIGLSGNFFIVQAYSQVWYKTAKMRWNITTFGAKQNSPSHPTMIYLALSSNCLGPCWSVLEVQPITTNVAVVVHLFMCHLASRHSKIPRILWDAFCRHQEGGTTENPIVLDWSKLTLDLGKATGLTDLSIILAMRTHILWLWK